MIVALGRNGHRCKASQPRSKISRESRGWLSILHSVVMPLTPRAVNCCLGKNEASGRVRDEDTPSIYAERALSGNTWPNSSELKISIAVGYVTMNI